jgi:hypothetical protein
MADEEPDEEHIRLRAYYLWLQAGGHHGADLDHWLEAEKRADPPPADAHDADTGKKIPLDIKFQDPA